jgi:RNA ligase
MDTRLLVEMVDEGYVKVQTHPDDARYKILNYTEKTVFARLWNTVTRQCRGLIIFQESEAQHAVILARPFAKFFNYGEPEAAKIGLDEPVAVFDKVDGSLGIYYIAPDGLPAIATRGSFSSPQALHATQVLRKRYRNFRAPEGLTPLFEIVYPENRIVLDYKGLDDLVLLGFVRHVDGAVFHPSPFVDRTFRSAEYFGTMPLYKAMEMMHREDAEGFVVIGSELGAMVKLKEEAYLALHKIIFGLTERAVWERMKAGDSVEKICEGLPDEFHPWVKEVYRRLVDAYWEIHDQAMGGFRYVISDPYALDSRKEFALRAKNCRHTALLFLLLDGQEERLEEKIFDMIKPEHRPYASSIAA